MTKLVVGCGYLGRRVAQRWLSAGEITYAVTRSASRAEVLRSLGLRPIVADVTDQASLSNLPVVDTVLYAVGFDRKAGHSMRDVYVDGLRNFLAVLTEDVGRLIYVSSTSVYGSHDGNWIDEDTVCDPATENGHICLAAEEVIARDRLAARTCVLRLAGIYGPQRIPGRESLMEGKPIVSAPDAHLNLIHVDDAATAVEAVARHPKPSARYLVADGQPVIRREFYRELARLLHTAEPRFADGAATGALTGRGMTDKRISNRRMLDELSIELEFPSYREGLAAIVGPEHSTDS